MVAEFRRRSFHAARIAAWAVAFCPLPRTLAAAEAKRPPNIVFLLTDDQRADTLGCYGNAIIQTPQIDRLAAEGVLFERMFVTTSICMTNRACILSGQYLSRHGINSFRATFSPQALEETYPGRLKAAGYRIGFVGKWGVGQPPRGLFDFDRAFAGQSRYYGRSGKDGNVHLTRWMGDQAIEFLDSSSSDQPFCLSISFKAPHVQDSNDVKARLWPADRSLDRLYQDATIPLSPLTAPEFFEALPELLKNTENRARWAVRFWGPARMQNSLRDYYRLVTGVDRVVGRIRHALASKQRDRPTVIIFTSDNGYYFGEYGFAGKWFPHDVSIRVPLIVYDPRVPLSRRGVREDAMALSIDMAPTILEYAGVPIPAAMQGRSLVPIASEERQGRAAGNRAAGNPPQRLPHRQPGTPEPAEDLVVGSKDWRSEFFYEHRFKHPGIPRSEGVRTERWKYIRYLDAQPPYEQLYDLAHDPLEAKNLASDASAQSQLAAMRAKWRQWRERVR